MTLEAAAKILLGEEGVYVFVPYKMCCYWRFSMFILHTTLCLQYISYLFDVYICLIKSMVYTCMCVCVYARMCVTT